MPEELIVMVLFVTIGLVAILRPLTKAMGRKYERSHDEPTAARDPQLTRMVQLMDRLVDRMDRLEDRVDFAERMLESRKALSSTSEAPVEQARGAEPVESRRRTAGEPRKPTSP